MRDQIEAFINKLVNALVKSKGEESIEKIQRINNKRKIDSLVFISRRSKKGQKLDYS